MIIKSEKRKWGEGAFDAWPMFLITKAKFVAGSKVTCPRPG